MNWWEAVSGAHAIGVVPALANLTHDSRLAGPGCGFAAVPGQRFDGHSFLEAAVAAGAPACVVQADRQVLWRPFVDRVPLLVVPDVRGALGHLAAAVHGNPSQMLRTVGVTGTDGKTTSTHLIAHVLDTCGLDAGYLSSVGFDTGAGFELNAMHMTTLEATSIQAMLAQARDANRSTMVLEASSEGLAQGRLYGCVPDIAVFTNLTRDHLDFHGTMESYRDAKAGLFRMLDLPNEKAFPRAAIVNADDPASESMLAASITPAVTYAVTEQSDFRASEVETDGFGLRFEVAHDGETVRAFLPMIGRFNAYNSLAAVAVACSQEVDLRDAVDALSSFPGVPGRMERIEQGQAFAVFVDIASTPAALENVLNALRPATHGRLLVVFGAAGGRDPARRTGMGAVAARLAEFSILTNEDPRDEDPDAIIEEIAAGLREGGRREGSDFVRLPDRREALRYAFEHAATGDTVLLAGKATETTMIFAQGPVPWDERATARELLG